MGAKPLQTDERGGVEDPAPVEPAEDLGSGRGNHPDVFVFVVKAMDATDLGRVDAAT